MLRLSGLTFENYKAFKACESIEVRPLTILIGRNSSGKSVVTRLPPLIARGLSDRAESPLELQFEGLDYGASFVDLVHRRFVHGSLKIGADFSDDEGFREKFLATVQFVSEERLALVSEFLYEDRGGFKVALRWNRESVGEESREYGIDNSGRVCRAMFRGLFPHSITPGKGDARVSPPANCAGMEKTLKAARDRLSRVMDSLAYLGPFRTAPERLHQFPPGNPRSLGFSGQRAAEVLGASLLRGRRQLLDAVGQWFVDHMRGWQLDISASDPNFSVVMRAPDDRTLEVNVADAGTGIAQVLAIIVQRTLAGAGETASNLEIVEQPELHLHPGAHGDLADLYIAAAKNNGHSFIVETHSENFILRVRRRVAEGAICPKNVILYWIDDDAAPTKIHPIELDPKGEVDFWPDHIFREDFEEVRAIRNAQKANPR